MVPHLTTALNGPLLALEKSMLGHMPDIEKRLIADFGMKHDGERWLEAWNLRDPGSAKPKR